LSISSALMRVSGAGGSMKSKCTRSSMPSFLRFSTTELKLDRRISGYVFGCKSYLFVVSNCLYILHNSTYLLESLLSVQAEALAGARPTGSSCALLRRGFRNRRHKQRFDTDTWIVDLLFRKSWIDDVNDTINRQRGLGNI
jgi:hypothetical protein